MNIKIDEFFDNANILVTGGTGFIGKVLIEKLLRCQSNINKIFILIRQKKGRNVEDRVRSDIFDQPIFQQLKQINPNYMEKIEVIQGDILEPRLDLSEKNIEKLLNEVNIVYNCAASINLTANLKYSMKYNVKSVLELLELCRRMKSLKAVVLVSTAFSNCNRKVVDEKIYESSVSPELVVRMCKELKDDVIEEVTKLISKGFPNGYTFSKSLMENSLHAYRDLPIILFRPAIVTSSYLEPLPGWTDNYTGPIGMYFSSAIGILRISPYDGEKTSNWVPVDYCVNALICSAWHGDRIRSSNNNDKVVIYNYACEKFKRKLDVFCKNLNSKNIRLERAVWKQIFINVNNNYLYNLLQFILQYMPMLLLDIIGSLSGSKIRLIKTYNEKIFPLLKALQFFACNEWTFGEENVTKMWECLSEDERKRYSFDSGAIDFDTYITNFWIGIKVYLAKEKMENNHKALQKDKM